MELKTKKKIVFSGLGFTLIELLIVSGIITLLSSFLISNFSRTRINLEESTSSIIADIRLAQAKATSSTKYNGAIRCGYGIHYENVDTYSIYVGADPSSTSCSSGRVYNSNFDVKILTKKFLDSRVQFKSPFSDIYFEPPDPTTYINGLSGSISVVITIGKVTGSCPQDCKTINVNTAGKIE